MDTVAIPMPLPDAPPLVPQEIASRPPIAKARQPSRKLSFREFIVIWRDRYCHGALLTSVREFLFHHNGESNSETYIDTASIKPYLRGKLLKISKSFWRKVTFCRRLDIPHLPGPWKSL
jgi:hypothetical protein